MKVESNLSEVILRRIDILEGMEIHTEQALRMGADNALALVQTRIQQEGLGINGQLTSKAKSKFGAYSRGWGYTRNKRGFQTGIIDYTFDGDLWRAWQILSVGDKEALIGFTDSQISKISGYLEEMHGKAFGLNEQEKEIVLASIKEYLVSKITG